MRCGHIVCTAVIFKCFDFGSTVGDREHEKFDVIEFNLFELFAAASKMGKYLLSSINSKS